MLSTPENASDTFADSAPVLPISAGNPLPLPGAGKHRALQQAFDGPGTVPDATLDQLVHLAAHICQVPVASVSLLHHSRRWFTARTGNDIQEVPLSEAFCAHAIQGTGLFMVPDAAADPRFARNTLVTGEAGVRFYASAPLVTSDNQVLGTLCVVDRVPRILTTSQQEALATLGQAVMDHLEVRQTLHQSVRAEQALRVSQEQTAAIITGALDCIITIDHEGCVVEWNPAAEATFGYPRAQAVQQSLADLIIPLHLRSQHQRGMQHYLRTGEGPALNQRLEMPAVRADGEEITVELAITPIAPLPGHPLLFTGYLRDITEQKRDKAALEQARSDLEMRVQERTGELARANAALQNEVSQRTEAEAQVRLLNRHLVQANRELTDAYDQTIEGWARALDLKDEETEGHSRRVTTLSLQLATRLGLSDGEKKYLRWGALLHDMGKMGIPDHILLKPEPLTPSEWAIMRRHPEYAREMLMPIAFLRPALDIPYCHHERWDGTGYPRGLRGQEIPLAARIFSIVDVWDALSSHRPYRAAWTEARVRAHIESLSGTHFDPTIVRAFLSLLPPCP